MRISARWFHINMCASPEQMRKVIKESEIEATYENGVLEICLPRPTSTNGKPLAKTIPVKV